MRWPKQALTPKWSICARWPAGRRDHYFSVKKTGRLVIVDEDNPRCSVATDIATLAATQALEYLSAPVKLVTAPAPRCP